MEFEIAKSYQGSEQRCLCTAKKYQTKDPKESLNHAKMIKREYMTSKLALDKSKSTQRNVLHL